MHKSIKIMFQKVSGTFRTFKLLIQWKIYFIKSQERVYTYWNWIRNIGCCVEDSRSIYTCPNIHYSTGKTYWNVCISFRHIYQAPSVIHRIENHFKYANKVANIVNRRKRKKWRKFYQQAINMNYKNLPYASQTYYKILCMRNSWWNISQHHSSDRNSKFQEFSFIEIDWFVNTFTQRMNIWWTFQITTMHLPTDQFGKCVDSFKIVLGPSLLIDRLIFFL